jgi:hypothetical protein
MKRLERPYSNIFVNEHVRNLVSEYAGNFECEPQVGVKPAVFKRVDRLARHTHTVGEVCLGPFPLGPKDAHSSFE